MASLSLYRKYRPQTFSEVVGQNHVKETLKNAVTAGRISHAYLFTGPRGIGKTTLARIFAKAINCKNPKNGEPDNKCDACEDILSGKSLDLIEIDGASNRGIDEIRELTDKIKFTPHNNKYKVFIIDEVHMLTKEAFNALLKTLEEPPSHAVFILATTEVHKIPSTVLSRCQRFNFSKITIEQMIKHLEQLAGKEKISASKESLQMIASYSEGALRDAISLLDQIASFGKQKITPEIISSMLGIASLETANNLLKEIISCETTKALNIIDETVQDGTDINIFIEDLIASLRNILFIQTGNSEHGNFFNEKEKKDLELLADKIDRSKLIKLIEKLSDAKQKTKYSIPPQLPLELVVIESAEKITSESKEEKSNREQPKIHKNDEKLPFNKPKRSFHGPKEKAMVEPKEGDNTETSNKVLKKGTDQGQLFQEIKNNWNSIVKKIKENNHALALCLETAGPEIVEDGHLTIAFDFPFHRDKVQSLDNKRLVEDVVEKMTGSFVPIRCSIRSKRDKVENQSLDEVVNIFGGEAI